VLQLQPLCYHPGLSRRWARFGYWRDRASAPRSARMRCSYWHDLRRRLLGRKSACPADLLCEQLFAAAFVTGDVGVCDARTRENVGREIGTRPSPPIDQHTLAVIREPYRPEPSCTLGLADVNAGWFGVQQHVGPLQGQRFFSHPQPRFDQQRYQYREPFWRKLPHSRFFVIRKWFCLTAITAFVEPANVDAGVARY